MVLDKNTILYFSGTGNSLQVAKDINKELKDFELYKISSIVSEEKIRIEGKVLGMVFPVFYARLPLIVEQVLKKLEISKDTYIFAIATYGGAPAEVLIKLKKILQDKSAQLNSGFLIKMPRNNIFAYSSISTKKQNELFKIEKKKVENISSIIRARKNNKCEKSKLMIDIFFDRASIQITDKIVENLHFRDEYFWVDEKCNGCKICEKICPVNNIKFNGNKPIWQHNCEQCAACIQYCPKQAIQWKDKTIKRKRYRNPNININELLDS